MDIRIQAIHFDASEKLEAYIAKKTERLAKHHADLSSVDITLKVVKPETAMNKNVTVKVMAPKTELFAEKTANTFEEALDSALDTIQRRLQDRKD